MESLPDTSLRDPRALPWPGWVGVILGWIAFLTGLFGGVEYSNPPQFHDIWVVCWVLCFVSIALSIASRFVRRNRATGLAANICIGVCLLGSWCPTQSYFGNYGTFPWLAVVGILGLTIGGGLACGLRVLPLTTAGFVAFWVYTSLKAPAITLPVTQTSDGIACTLISADNYGCRFRLTDLHGRELSRVVNLERVDVDGGSGPLIQADDDHAFALRDFMETPKGASVEFSSHTHSPSWARSFDLRITVPRWPDRPELRVTIPLGKLPTRPISARSASYSLDVSNVGWSKTTTMSPPEECLRATISYSGFSYSGSDGKEYRVVDDIGNLLPCSVNGVEGSEQGSTETVEIRSIDPKARNLTVELMSESEMERSQTVFHFDGIAPSARQSN